MRERALLFGPVAGDYERYRLGYPDELVDRVLAFAGRPVSTALEIGAGTGKATRLFAAHYVGHLSTISAYLELPAPDRADVLDRVLAGPRPCGAGRGRDAPRRPVAVSHCAAPALSISPA